MSEESGQHRRRRRSRHSRRRDLIKRVLALTCGLLLMVAAGVFLKTQIGSVPQIAGVWKGAADGRTYEIDQQQGHYLLVIDGKRLAVRQEEVDRRRGEVRIRVQTDSGLVADWGLKPMQTADAAAAIHLDKDGLASEALAFQRALTPAERQQLQQLATDTTIRWSPSFACSQASTVVQRMLCTDPALAASDVRLAALAKTAGKEGQEAGIRWEKAIRDACLDLGCLRDAYSARMVALNIKREAADAARIERTLDLSNQLSGLSMGATGGAPATAPVPDDSLSDAEDDSAE